MAALLVIIACMLGACGRIGFAPLPNGAVDAADAADAADAGPDAALGIFQNPVPVVELYDGHADDDPCLTHDTLEIFFDSDRPGGGGGHDIWTATRASLAAPWSPPTEVVELNSANVESTPEVSGDGLAMWFASDRANGGLDLDIYVATRPNRGAPWSAPSPVAELTSTQPEFAPTPSADLLHMYMARGPGAAPDLYYAARSSPTSAWSPPAVIAELSSPDSDSDPAIDANETTIYWSSTRSGGSGGIDIWMATRQPAAPFGNLKRVAELDSAMDDSDPWLSPDGHTMFFARGIGGSPSQIFMATR